MGTITRSESRFNGLRGVALAVTGLGLAVLSSGLVSCGKSDKKSKDSPSSSDALSVTAIEVGREFSVTGTMSPSGDGFAWQQEFRWVSSAEENLAIREVASMTECPDGAEISTFYMVTSADGVTKLASVPVDGYTYREGQFPGKVGPATYNLTLVMAASGACKIHGANFVLEVASAPLNPQNPDPQPSNEPNPEPTPSAEPTVQPTPDPQPSPVSPAVDARIVGSWRTGLDGVFVDDLLLSSDGRGSEKIVIEGSTFVNFEFSLSSDTSVTPARLTMTVTRVIERSSDAEIAVGDKNFCIYEPQVSGKLRLECDAQFPVEFSPEAAIYDRISQ